MKSTTPDSRTGNTEVTLLNSKRTPEIPYETAILEAGGTLKDGCGVWESAQMLMWIAPSGSSLFLRMAAFAGKDYAEVVQTIKEHTNKHMKLWS